MTLKQLTRVQTIWCSQ